MIVWIKQSDNESKRQEGNDDRKGNKINMERSGLNSAKDCKGEVQH